LKYERSDNPFGVLLIGRTPRRPLVLI